MPAMTRATIEGVRAEIYSAEPGAWWWQDATDMAPSGPFRTSALAIADAQRVWGPAVVVAQYKDKET